MATTVNFNLDQGQTFHWSFIWATAGATSTDPPVPYVVTGCTARMQVRAKYGTDVLVELTTENAGITLGPAAGQVQLLLTDEQTDMLGSSEDSLKPRKIVKYDLEIVFPSGDVTRVIQGEITFDPNITREVLV